MSYRGICQSRGQLRNVVALPQEGGYGIEARLRRAIESIAPPGAPRGGRPRGRHALLHGIVAEVFIGLLQLDPDSYLSAQPEWAPTLPTHDGNPASFRMNDFLTFAGVDPGSRGQ